MKSLKNGYIFIILFGLGLLSACNDDFMERYPKTEITKENFFSNPKDLETYTNGLYEYLQFTYNDVQSDNISHYNSSSSEIDKLLRGDIIPSNVSGWSWTKLRKINFFMDNYRKAVGDGVEINHYAGIARFFRAWDYMDKVKRYGDVPWYSKALGTKDTELLYKNSDPRALVVDSIMADLAFAAANIKSVGHKTTITKNAALLLQARIALHEGTFRKYHTEEGFSDANSFLEIAAKATDEIIKNGGYILVPNYTDLFISQNLSANSEIIMYADYDFALNRKHNSQTVLDYEYAVSKDLADTYLLKDGKPFTSLAGYDTITLNNIFSNRDERLKQTVMVPGYVSPGQTTPFLLKPYLGGYVQIKYYPVQYDMLGWDNTYTDLPIFRYAEALLINAEAKAELGTLTQSDLDKTINLLRTRAKITKSLNLAEANANIDPILAAKYPNVSGANRGVILEIRRERRVELACEGFRYDDIMRWALGNALAVKQKGMYVKELGAIDITGDGIPDIAILESSDKTGPIDGLPPTVKAKLNIYPLKDKNGNAASFYLENGTSGNIMFTVQKTSPKTFKSPQYYYYPIPEKQLLLNQNLQQQKYWK